MNWKLTLLKGVVIGALATLAIWIGEMQNVQAMQGVPPWWAGIAVVVLETVRDFLKTRFGALTAK